MKISKPVDDSAWVTSTHGSLYTTDSNANTVDAITGSFKELKAGEKAAGRQAEFESRWDAAVVQNYADAKALAGNALTAK